MDSKSYEEVGQLYRYFLTWRHATVAGIAALAYAAFSLAMATSDNRLAGWILLLASLISFVLWLFDVRTRHLYRFAMQAGAEIEKAGNVYGFYRVIEEAHIPGWEKLPWFQRWPVLRLIWYGEVTHSAALSLLFVGTSVVLAGAGIIFWFGRRL